MIKLNIARLVPSVKVSKETSSSIVLVARGAASATIGTMEVSGTSW